MSVLSGLQPADVFGYFEKLCAVPHGSGNTKQISDLCAGFAQEPTRPCPIPPSKRCSPPMRRWAWTGPLRWTART